VKRSTLSDANNRRDNRIYHDLFFTMYQRVQGLAPKYKLNLPRELYVIDSTTIDLCLTLYPWARFRKNKAGVKLHTLLNCAGSLPEFINITDAKTHDAKGAVDLPVPKKSFLAKYNQYNNNDIRFVTRLKTNAAFKVIRTIESGHPAVIADDIIEFTGHTTHKKYPHPLRKITWRDPETQKRLIFLTNELELPAQTIADIYRARWEIELFFKIIKQNLKIKRFFGCSENAVRTQIWIAMIVYLMISFLKFSNNSTYSVQQLFRILQINLFQRTSLTELIKGINTPTRKSNQIALFPI
jgi:putative transposase